MGQGTIKEAQRDPAGGSGLHMARQEGQGESGSFLNSASALLAAMPTQAE